MANDYKNILSLANKNNMGLSNTIKRDYGIPLDYSSVQETYEAALEYAKTSTLAYVGQPISVGDTLYIVTGKAGDQALKQVGTKPVGDNKSIDVSAEGTVSIHGFTAAAQTTLPMKQADGTLAWTTLADIAGKTDTNTKTVVAVADGSDITVNATYDKDSDTHTYTLDVQFPAIPEYAISKTVKADSKTTEYKLTKDGTAVAETIIVPDAYDDSTITKKVTDLKSDVDAKNTAITSRLAKIEGAETEEGSINKALADAKSYTDTEITGLTIEIVPATENTPIKLVIKNNAKEIVADVDASAFIKDGMLKDAKFDSKTNELVFTWNTDAGIAEDRVSIANFVDTYTAKKDSGLTLTDHEFSIDTTVIATKASVDAVSKALTTETGARKEAVTNLTSAISTAKSEAIDAANTETSSQIGTAKEALTGQINAVDGKFASYYDIKTIDSKVSTLSGATSKVAGDLATEITNRTDADTALDERIGAVETSINSLGDTYATDAEVETIRSTIVTNADKKYDTKENVTKIKGELEGQISAETTARGEAITGLETAYKAADTVIEGKIGTINTTLTNHTSTLSTHGTNISNNASAIELESTKRAELAGVVEEQGRSITALTEKDGTLEASITANTEKFSNYSTTTQMTSAISTAINALSIADYAKTTDVDSKISAAQKILEAADTTLSGRIDGIDTALTNTNKTVSDHGKRIKTLETDNTQNKADIAQAKLDITANAKAVEAVDNALKLVINNPDTKDVDSLKELATWVTEHGAAAATMTSNISKNTDAITAINDEKTGILATADDHANTKVQALANGQVKTNTDAIAILNADVSTSGSVDAKIDAAIKAIPETPIATTEVAGLVKASTDVSVATSGEMSVTRVSTDVLVNGENVLVLYGGTALD